MEKYDKKERLKELLSKKIVDVPFDDETEIGASEIINYLIECSLGNKEKQIAEIEQQYDYDEYYQNQDFIIKEKEDLMNEFDKYQQEIESLSNEDLIRKFIDMENVNYNRFRYLFNESILGKKNMDKWYKMSGWKVKEFIYISNGFDPELLNIEELNFYKNRIIFDFPEKNIISKFNDDYEIIKNAIECKYLTIVKMNRHLHQEKEYEDDMVRKKDWINWSKENDISLPKEFLEKKSISELEKENQDLRNKIDNNENHQNLKDKISELEKILSDSNNLKYKQHTGKKRAEILISLVNKENFENRKIAIQNIVDDSLKKFSVIGNGNPQTLSNELYKQYDFLLSKYDLKDSFS